MYICHIHDRIMTRLMTIFPAFTAVIMILCSFGVSGSLDSSFKSLDQYIATRDSYVSRKENSIEALKSSLSHPATAVRTSKSATVLPGNTNHTNTTPPSTIYAAAR